MVINQMLSTGCRVSIDGKNPIAIAALRFEECEEITRIFKKRLTSFWLPRRSITRDFLLNTFISKKIYGSRISFDSHAFKLKFVFADPLSLIVQTLDFQKPW
jgi:hypothetical protein